MDRDLYFFKSLYFINKPNKKRNKMSEPTQNKPSNNKEVIYKKELVTLLSEANGYTKRDNKIFLNSIETVFQQIMEMEADVILEGLFSFKIKEHDPIDPKTGKVRKMWDQIHKVWIDDHYFKFIFIKPSKVLQEILKIKYNKKGREDFKYIEYPSDEEDD